MTALTRALVSLALMFALVSAGCGDDAGADGQDATDSSTGADTADSLASDGTGVVEGDADARDDARADTAVAADDAVADAAEDTAPAQDTTPPADRTRAVIVQKPYTATGAESRLWEVWTLAPDGALTPTATTFEMGRSPWNPVHFTADGRVAVVAQIDGTVGVVRFDDALAPTVVHAGYAEGFYASALQVVPGGDAVIVADGNWPNNGGGLFRVAMAPDGTLSAPVRLTESKLARGLLWLGGADDRVVVAAAAIAGAAEDAGDVHLLSLTAPVTRLASVTAFAAGDESVSAAALTGDGRFALFGENSLWSGVPHRIAVVEVAGDTLVARQELTPCSDPAAIVVSPWDDAALVTCAADSDAIYALSYDPEDAAGPFAVVGEVAYSGGRPALPGAAAVVARGALTGRVIVSENVALRQLQFAPGGGVTDLGTVTTGEGLDHINGSVGVQP